MSPCAEAVRCLYLPLTEDGALVPVANVVEVIALTPAVPLEGVPAWIAGEVTWREGAVVLCTWEPLVGGRFHPPGRRGRIVILRGLADPERLPFVAVVVQAVPRVVLASGESVCWIPPKGASPADGGDGYAAGWVRAGEREAWIPDLDAVEAAVAAAIGIRPP